jgi:hypothetical protein
LSEWDLSKWLESLAYLAAILGSISACIVFLLRHRRTSIEVIRSTIGRAWTNEGDISSNESILITLDLEDHDGDIIGQISSSAHDRLLEAHVDVGWLTTTLHVSELLGRSALPIGTVTLQLIGNKNRLKWRLKKNAGQEILPTETILWPSSVGVS